MNEFKPAFDAELNKVNTFVVSRAQELQNRIMMVLRSNAPWKGKDFGDLITDDPNTNIQFTNQEILETVQFLNSTKQELDTISQEIIDLDKFIRQNCTDFAEYRFILILSLG